MPKYRLKPGCKHYMRVADPTKRGLIRFNGGDFIDLTEKQAHHIMAKLEMVGATVEEEEIAEVIEEKAEAAKPEIVPTEPEDDQDEGEYFNVLHAETGLPMNDIPLSRAAAEALAGV